MRQLFLWSSALLLSAACSAKTTPYVEAAPSQIGFAESAYPILLRDCGYPACHGERDRFFRVFGPGRTRFSTSPDVEPSDPATPDEIEQSYDRARSMIDVARPGESLLLRKPLAGAAGGSGHKGVDVFGRNVYASTADPNFQALAAWVLSMAARTADAGVAP